MRVFFDVDTQNDFMDKGGALYVPNAELIKPNLEKLTNYALKKRIPILGSMDWHYITDKELRRNGGPFPDHCIVKQESKGSMAIGIGWIEDKPTKGCKKIKETKVNCNIYVHDFLICDYFDISNLKYKGKGGEINYHTLYFTKHEFDVFTNKHTGKFLKDLDVTEAITYGVATDCCVKAAVLGMRKLGIDVLLVTDAIKPVKEEDGKKALEEMVSAGVNFVTTEEVIENGWKN